MWNDLAGFGLEVLAFAFGLGGGGLGMGFLRATSGSAFFFLRRSGGAPGGGGLAPFGLGTPLGGALMVTD